MKYVKILWILIIGAVFFAGCESNYKLAQSSKPQAEHYISDRSIEYRILPQDRLQVVLYKDPNQNVMVQTQELEQPMTREGILVNTAGDIILPLIGKVHIAGLTQTQAAEKITQKYKRYLNTPSVYVEVLNKRLYVLGEVKKPGVVKIDKEKMTLFEAIAFAGDLTDSAVRDNIIIISNHPIKGLQMRHVDLTDFDHMRYADLMLRPNDLVYVQPDNWKEFKVTADNFTKPFEVITKVAAPFVTLKYLSDD